jgi:hypothetical protein
MNKTNGQKELLAVYEQELKWARDDLNRAIQKAVREGRDAADCWIVQSCFSEVKLKEMWIGRYRQQNTLR